MEPFYDFTPNRWILIPTVSVGLAECPHCDCGSTAVMIVAEFLCFSVGIAIPNN